MRRKAALISIIAFLLLAGAVYAAGILYFEDHFFPGTKVNGMDCGFQTWQETEKRLSREAHAFALAVNTRNNGREAVYADEVGLEYSSDGSVERFLKDQPRLRWFLYLGNPRTLDMEKPFQYNRQSLEEKADTLKCLRPENQVYPEDAEIVEKDGSYVVRKEVLGTALDKDKVLEVLGNAISHLYPEVNLSEQGCYYSPKVYADDASITANCELMNQLKEVYITYDFADDKAVVDWVRVQNMLSEDESGVLYLDEQKVKDFVAELGQKFDSVGSTRSFTTYDGRRIEVGGGDFGWVIDVDAETPLLIEDIMNAEIKVKEPVYEGGYENRTSRDIGATYVEVDLGNQRLVYYHEGVPEIDTRIVSGAPTEITRTPTGVFSIQDKQHDLYLEKDGMGASVDFWLPFEGDIGFHDSTWRTDYQIDTYIFDGTIGCIHVPYDAMKSLYDSVEIGTPVVIYEG